MLSYCLKCRKTTTECKNPKGAMTKNNAEA